MAAEVTDQKARRMAAYISLLAESSIAMSRYQCYDHRTVSDQNMPSPTRESLPINEETINSSAHDQATWKHYSLVAPHYTAC
jgi:hypothetical protein